MDKGLEKRVRRVAGRVEEIVKREFGLTWWRLTQEDEIRCLRLEQWEEKYKVGLTWILKTLVPIWKQKFARYSMGAFGVKIPTLVGQKSEEILKEKIKELYPDGENIRQWKATGQQQQWFQYRTGVRQTENWELPMHAIKEYQQRMERERQDRKEFERRARFRPYRNNPWIV